MGRIKVPYHLLQANPSLETTEKQIDLNVYCMEIIHALGVAESAAVPQRRVRIGTEAPRWKENPLLAQLCHASKFWHKMWMDIGKPWSGAVNTVRIYLKRKFAKCLQKHNATILNENSSTLKSDPNAVWNFLKGKKRCDCNGPSLWPTEEQWNSNYKIEFAAPDAQLVSKYKDNLDLLLSEASPSLGFVVTVSDVQAAIIKAKKKFSRGIDQVCGIHLAHGSQSVLEHLTLLYQMIFTCGLVPDSFCVGVFTPVLKKGKDPAQCGSHRPITVVPVPCNIFELLFIDELCRVCESPDNQFVFKQSVSREHVHHLICNVLLECDQIGERVTAPSHDVRRAFDSGVHAQILSCELKRGLDR
ncbi:uncharacterized protein LOC136041729 [Artemia franciscana]|uniref:uncharacterized protein LOC136041729 n=1 Tax=Artemia franciscana TaxID=6661 RepID=UPI0032DA7DB1